MLPTSGSSVNTQKQAIKAITLHQPWAWLVGRGKGYETRSWATNYRGKIAIHAAAKSNAAQAKAMVWAYENIAEYLPDIDDLVFGSIVAIADLTECVRMSPDLILMQLPQERACGDWHTGRFAWKLENVQILQQPITATGGVGLWEWEWEQIDNGQLTTDNRQLTTDDPPMTTNNPLPVPLSLFPVPCSPLTITNKSKPRYTWKEAPGWWNPQGEEIAEERGDYVVLDYGGKLIPRTDLIQLLA